MLARRLALVAIATVSVLPVVSASAQTCPQNISAGGPASPNIIDPTNDWNGVVLGNGSSLTGVGDVYREGTDITAAWFSHGDDSLRANIQVVNLSKAQPNSAFYFLWDHEGPEVRNPGTGAVNPSTVRWVSASLRATDELYRWGYLGPAATPTASGTFVTLGETTGEITEGEGGVISIDLPTGLHSIAAGSETQEVDADYWGKPALGSELVINEVSSRILVGTPYPLPPNPSGLRSGFLYVADSSENSEDQCDALVDAKP